MMSQDQVLQLVKSRGPIIPSQISKEIGTNILLASAILSELASRNLVKISAIKIGGSPLYYVSGQEDKLQDYIGKLNDKEKQAIAMLSESKVLRDSKLEPAARFALRQCRDFAKPLEVTVNGQKEIFWKWYLVPMDQVETLIKKELGVPEQKLEQKKQPEPKREPVLQSQIARQQAPRLQEQVQEAIQDSIIDEEPEPEIIRAEPRLKLKARPNLAQLAVAEELVEKKAMKQAFIDSIMVFFKMKKITVMEEQIIRKNKEMLFLVKVPSAVGELVYCCFAKDKKICSESDLSYAYVQGQVKKLPVLFITTGELTKKARELLQSNEFSNLTYAKV